MFREEQNRAGVKKKRVTFVSVSLLCFTFAPQNVDNILRRRHF